MLLEWIGLRTQLHGSNVHGIKPPLGAIVFQIVFGNSGIILCNHMACNQKNAMR